MYPKAIVRIVNVSRSGLEVNNDRDIQIVVSDPQSMMLEMGKLRTAVEIVLIVPDPYDLIDPLCEEYRYVLAGLDRSQNPWKSIPPDPKEIDSKIAELTAIGRKFLRIFDLLPQ